MSLSTGKMRYPVILKSNWICLPVLKLKELAWNFCGVIYTCLAKSVKSKRTCVKFLWGTLYLPREICKSKITCVEILWGNFGCITLQVQLTHTFLFSLLRKQLILNPDRPSFQRKELCLGQRAVCHFRTVILYWRIFALKDCDYVKLELWDRTGN